MARIWIDTQHVEGQGEQQDAMFECPGCGSLHAVRVKGSDPWTYNGDMERPTFSPSVRCRWPSSSGQQCCHFFVKDGEIQFCSDSTHELAGKAVVLPTIERSC